MGTILLERSSINVERINQIKIGSLVGANSGTSDFRFCSGLNLFNGGVPLKFNKGALLFCKHGVWAEQLVRLRCNTALTASPSLYEPLLGENREVGEIPDSTLTQNPRLI